MRREDARRITGDTHKCDLVSASYVVGAYKNLSVVARVPLIVWQHRRAAHADFANLPKAKWHVCPGLDNLDSDAWHCRPDAALALKPVVSWRRSDRHRLGHCHEWDSSTAFVCRSELKVTSSSIFEHV